jgi:hypothetical protein
MPITGAIMTAAAPLFAFIFGNLLRGDFGLVRRWMNCAPQIAVRAKISAGARAAGGRARAVVMLQQHGA